MKSKMVTTIYKEVYITTFCT